MVSGTRESEQPIHTIVYEIRSSVDLGEAVRRKEGERREGNPYRWMVIVRWRVWGKKKDFGGSCCRPMRHWNSGQS